MRTAAAWVLIMVGCGGSPFGQDSTAGDELAGAPSSAGSIGAGGAVVPSGGRAGSSAGGSNAEGGGGSSSSGAPAAAAGEGGDGDVVEPALVPCDVSGWTAKAFAEYEDTYGGPAAFALDGDEMTRWSGGVPQEPGQWFEVDGLQGVAALEVRSTHFPNDVPEKIGLQLDDVAAGTTQTTDGEGVLRVSTSGLEQATKVRVLLVEPGNSLTWWSIGEIGGSCRR